MNCLSTWGLMYLEGMLGGIPVETVLNASLSRSSSSFFGLNISYELYGSYKFTLGLTLLLKFRFILTLLTLYLLVYCFVEIFFNNYKNQKK